MKTPGGADLVAPTPALTAVLAEEARAQGAKPNPVTMPMTQLAATAIDITRKKRQEIVEQVSAYAASELLCHRAEQPEELICRQQEIWQPILDWCAARFGARLCVGQGIMPLAQPLEALQALRNAVESQDDFRLTGLKQAVETSGSLVLGLALAEGYLTAEEVFQAAECDALFQINKWGDDPAAAKRLESVRRDLEICEKWVRLLKAS